MKVFSTIFLAILTTSVFSQEIITKEVGDFNELKVYDLIVVTLIPSNENKVVIKGEDVQDVNIVNKNGTLKVKMETEKIFRGEDTYVEVYFKSIDIIDANEGSYIVGNEMISQNTIELRAQEGGKIKVGLEVNHTKIKAVTGGIVEASGVSKSQDITLSSGGISGETEDTTIGVTAAGKADIYASNKAEVRVAAGGNVTIYGNPKTVNEKTFAGGRIKRMN